MDLRKKIVYQRAQRHLKQSLDSMDISELKPPRGRYNDRQIRDDADKQSRGRTFNGERRERKSRYELYDDKDPVRPLRYAGKPTATKKMNEDKEAMIDYEKWRPISYTEWRNAELRKKKTVERNEASTSAKRHHTNWRDVESNKQRQQRKSSHNISNTSNNMEATRNKYSSVEVVHVNNGPKVRTTHRDRSPSVEILKELPPRRMTTHTLTVKQTTIQHHQITTTSRRQ